VISKAMFFGGGDNDEEGVSDTEESGIFDMNRLIVEDEENDKLEVESDPMPDDLYGAAMESIIRDSQKIADGTGAFCLRQARMCTTMCLLLGIILLQLFLLAEIKKNITAKAVRGIRELYSDYEFIMYEGNVKTLDTGFYRGKDDGDFVKDQFYNDTAWAALGYDPDDARDATCQIPLSQPWFFAAVLLLWTFTSLLQFLNAGTLLFSLLCLPNIHSAADAITTPDPESPKELLIEGLPWYMKISLCGILLLQEALTLVLLWLGSRWLAATEDFSDLVLNAVALEFILLLKESVFSFLIPERNKREVRNTQIPPWHGQRHDSATWMSYFGRLIWLIIAVIWVALYLTVGQQVLPEYQWDVHEVCSKFIKDTYKITKN